MFDRVRDPLTEKFDLSELPSIAPWIYDEITAVGVDEVKNKIVEMGEDPDDAQPMTNWVAAVSRIASGSANGHSI